MSSISSSRRAVSLLVHALALAGLIAASLLVTTTPAAAGDTCYDYSFTYTNGSTDEGTWCGGNTVTRDDVSDLNAASLHVSCSDRFTDGTSDDDKSDLDGLTVEAWSIVKYKDGEVDKTCSSDSSDDEKSKKDKKKAAKAEKTKTKTASSDKCVEFLFVYNEIDDTDDARWCGGNEVTRDDIPDLNAKVLHISCSDTFEGGVSDGQSDLDGLTIESYVIKKFGKDGSVKKICPEGADFPEDEDPEGEDPEGEDPEGEDPEGEDPEDDTDVCAEDMLSAGEIRDALRDAGADVRGNHDATGTQATLVLPEGFCEAEVHFTSYDVPDDTLAPYTDLVLFDTTVLKVDRENPTDTDTVNVPDCNWLSAEYVGDLITVPPHSGSVLIDWGKDLGASGCDEDADDACTAADPDPMCSESCDVEDASYVDCGEVGDDAEEDCTEDDPDPMCAESCDETDAANVECDDVDDETDEQCTEDDPDPMCSESCDEGGAMADGATDADCDEVSDDVSGDEDDAVVLGIQLGDSGDGAPDDGVIDDEGLLPNTGSSAALILLLALTAAVIGVPMVRARRAGSELA